MLDRNNIEYFKHWQLAGYSLYFDFALKDYRRPEIAIKIDRINSRIGKNKEKELKKLSNKGIKLVFVAGENRFTKLYFIYGHVLDEIFLKVQMPKVEEYIKNELNLG